MSDRKGGQPPQQQSRQPGRESQMDPQPEYEPRYPGSGRLQGKVAIVTGGDSGIGRAVAVLFAREGANVTVAYLEEDEDAKVTLQAIEAEGSEGLLVRGDIGAKSFCEDIVAQTLARFGRIDILVNNAAEQHAREAIDEIPEAQLEKTIRTNFFGYFFLTQAAVRHMEKGSAIINTTSITAYRGQPQLIDYASTKGAIVAFTRSLATNLADKGIRVNGVAPGPIWTPLIPASFPKEKVAEFGTSQPLGRAGQPNEVAPCHLFLACEDSSYMTGQVLHPNGGEVVGG